MLIRTTKNNSRETTRLTHNRHLKSSFCNVIHTLQCVVECDEDWREKDVKMRYEFQTRKSVNRTTRQPPRRRAQSLKFLVKILTLELKTRSLRFEIKIIKQHKTFSLEIHNTTMMMMMMMMEIRMET